MASASSFRYRTSPIIIILGATAVGKTKLSVHLAKRFQGEIVNADSMQIYDGLDIATAKPTLAERDGVPHHLFSYVNPLDRSHTVVDYRNDALPIVKIWKIRSIDRFHCFFIRSNRFSVDRVCHSSLAERIITLNRYFSI